MFSLFKKSNRPAIRDVVFFDENYYISGIAKWLGQNPGGIAAAWFQQDLHHLQSQLHSFPEDRFVLAGRLSPAYGTTRNILFAGHYPLHQPEITLCENLGLDEMTFYLHLDMSLLRAFGSERIKVLMAGMGGMEEPLSHSMISASISRAQKKIEQECVADMSAASEAEWMAMNMPAKI